MNKKICLVFAIACLMYTGSVVGTNNMLMADSDNSTTQIADSGNFFNRIFGNRNNRYNSDRYDNNSNYRNQNRNNRNYNRENYNDNNQSRRRNRNNQRNSGWWD